MKKSIYTHIIKKGSCSILYNCRTDVISAVENQLANLLENEEIEKIGHIHPTFYKFLKDLAFIVPKDNIEYQTVIETWKTEEKNGSYSIFINPTLDCNLDCWYCYEKHRKGTIMDKKVHHSLIALLNKLIAEKSLKILNLSFFGGEPLLAFKKVIIPLIQDIWSRCKEQGIKLNVNFVTNGTLLTQANINLLNSLGLPEKCTFQITFDGNSTYHDITKKFASGEGSYHLILEHLKYVLDSQMKVTVRLNMTAQNVDSYYDLLTDLKSVPTENREYATIDFQHVWQDSGNISADELLKKKEKLREAFLEEGFKVNELKEISPYRCYADRANHITLNYNGDLYKCTAEDFVEEKREGILHEDGTLTWNEKWELRDSLRFGNDFCHQCHIFPLCHGGCSRYKIESQHNKKCIKGYETEKINQIIEDRVNYLLELLTLNA